MRRDGSPGVSRRDVTVLLAFVVLAVALVAARQLAPEPDPVTVSAAPPVAGTATAASPDVTARILAMQREALDLVREAAGVGGGGPARVVRLSPTRAALVLVSRPTPYGVADLLAFPEAATRSGDGSVTVRLPVVVLHDASLVLDSALTPQVRLLSPAGAPASLVGLGGSLRLAGSAGRPLDVTSLDPVTGTADEHPDDGRAFVLEMQGRMDVSHVRASALGFGPGMASGMAWAGTAYDPARGDVSHSTFRRNRYGAYTFHAVDMQWTDDVFADNQVYGLAVHDFSSHLVVRGSTAERNGRHGFVLSRGCDDNLFEDNRAEGNLGDGFVLTDAPLPGRSDRAAPVLSRNNVLRRNTAMANGGSGMDVQGGRDTSLVGNHLDDNRLGARFRATATGMLEGNQLRRNAVYGVQIESGAGDVVLRDNRGTGSWADLAVARPVQETGNSFDVRRDTTPRDRHPLADLSGRAAHLVRSRPALAVWLVVLGLPLLARGLVRL